MSILIGQITATIFNSRDYYVMEFKHGKTKSIVIYNGSDPPKELKTVFYAIEYETTYSSKYGAQKKIVSYKKTKPVAQLKKCDYKDARLGL